MRKGKTLFKLNGIVALWTNMYNLTLHKFRPGIRVRFLTTRGVKCWNSLSIGVLRIKEPTIFKKNLFLVG